MNIRSAFVIYCIFLSVATVTAQTTFVRSKDKTRIAVECSGAGPNLLIVHGGSGDRKRWKPLMPLFAKRFTVCAMDRRGHGESEVGSNYSLQKEIDDVVAVANSRPGPVFVLGHSIGGVFALEASHQTKRISKLVLYEPPLQDLDHSVVAAKMEQMIKEGKREQALITFLGEIVMMTPQQIDAIKARRVWPERVAGIDIQIREIRALSKYRFQPERMKKLKTPTLLLLGSETASPQLKQATRSLMDALPSRTLFVFEGQDHNAMDTIPEKFAEAVTKFLIE